MDEKEILAERAANKKDREANDADRAANQADRLAALTDPGILAERAANQADRHLHQAALNESDILESREANQKERAANQKDRLANEEDRRANQADRHLHQATLSDAQHKDLFIATVVHELRNPISPIQNSMRVLEKDFGPHKSFQIVERQVAKLNRLVNDLLDVARIKSGKFHLDKTPVCLCFLAADVVSNIPSDRIGITLKVQNVVIAADAIRLDQVITNLLLNALRYTQNGGVIEVSVDKDDRYAILCVADTGVGIPADVMSHIFELFFQEQGLKTPGSLGVGLFLCKSIIESHGGTISVESAGHNKGSTFTIKLPL